MSDPEEPKQQPTPAKTPKKPQAPEQEDSDQSMEDPGYQSGRSRSQSRRRRRQNQRQRAQQQQQPQDGGSGGGAQAQTMAKIEEEQNAMPELEEDDVMQPFERIGMLKFETLLQGGSFCIRFIARMSHNSISLFTHIFPGCCVYQVCSSIEVDSHLLPFS